MMVNGHWLKPDVTASDLVGSRMRADDIVRLDAEAFCRLVDRAEDVIMRSGKTAIRSVENVLYQSSRSAFIHSTLEEEPVPLSTSPSTTEPEAQVCMRSALRLGDRS
jgi:long-chain acyl-CoA synthetase